MIRGTITFKCTNCKKTFRGLNVEYNATVFSVPQRCKHCNSIRTLPLFSYSRILSIFGFTKRNIFYEKIWEEMESRK